MFKLSKKLSTVLGITLTILQFSFIAISHHYSKIAASLFDYKTATVGDINAATPYQHLSDLYMACWITTIVLAVVLGSFSPAKQRTIIFLFPVLVLPALEFISKLFLSF